MGKSRGDRWNWSPVGFHNLSGPLKIPELKSERRLAFTL